MVADQPVVQALEQDFAEAPQNTEAMGSVIMMIIRTRFIEERLEHAIRDGMSQVVILGAGFDTRAYRLTELLKAARVFEVDQPSTQEYKKRRIRETGIEVPPNLTYVPVDFRHDKLGDVLTAAGYDSSQKTFFIWEGVTMYLPEAAVEETLRWVAAQAPGSTIIFDFVGAMVVKFMATADLSKFPEAAKRAIERLRKTHGRRALDFRFPGHRRARISRQAGIRAARSRSRSAARNRSKRYLTRSDGTPYYRSLRPAAASATRGYCLAEAVVPG